MAFIGPRPLLLAEQAACPAARLLVRPGLTGWAQVNGGRKLSVNDKLVLDLWYIKHASCKLDLQIALRTVGLLIWGEQINTRVIAAARKEFGLKGLPTDQSRDRRGDHTDTQSSESLGLLKGYSADAVRSNVL